MITIAKPIEADVLRIRHEFLEMSGLRLTVAQTARLVGVSLAHATVMLDALVEEEFLSRTTDGAYGRAHPLRRGTAGRLRQARAAGPTTPVQC